VPALNHEVVVPPTGEIPSLLTATVDRYLGEGTPLRVLDAGCGRMWTWDLGARSIHLTGIDIDEDALRLRVQERGDLDDWMVCDLRTVELPKGSFDLVHSAFVLEHISGAEQVLDRMCEALRPGGLMVVKIPDRDSVYGFLTRMTPHRFHVWYKRRIRRKPLAGTAGHGPYPVVYDRVVSLRGITRWADSRGLHVVALYGDNSHLHFFGRAAPLVDRGMRLVALASGHRLTARYANLALALQKPAPPD